ncbi:DUF5988 family protein [Streptomyces murinus]
MARSSCCILPFSVPCAGSATWLPDACFPSFPACRPWPRSRTRRADTRAGACAHAGEPPPEVDMPNTTRVLLSGGPDWISIPTLWKVRSLEMDPKVKILCGNAYEHFEFSGSYSLHDGERLPVYRWCRRTYVAE